MSDDATPLREAAPAVLVAGALSGIQGHLFDVAQEGGRQARQLRARSFHVQLLAECAELRVRAALGWGPSTVLVCGAGRFLLEGPGTPGYRKKLDGERADIERQLLAEGAQLRFSLAADDEPGTTRERYQRLMARLQAEKLRPWAASAVNDGRWRPESLILSPLDPPCALCRHRRAETEERDPDTGEVRRICRRCHAERSLGASLPSARWLVIRSRPRPKSTDLEVLGYGVAVQAAIAPALDGEVVAAANLLDPERPPPGLAPDRQLVRRLARHVPTQDGRLLEFVELARRARGDELLGVIKMDVDSLGHAFDRALGAGDGLARVRSLSAELDRFFAEALGAEQRTPRFADLYTVFAGGDDLLLVGPWDAALDFAGRIQELFAARFGALGLTISAGVALIKPKRPIRQAAEAAEAALHRAKTDTAADVQPKDQCAAFGQVWKWRDHAEVRAVAQRLAGWVEAGAAERGWLHTVLELAMARRSGELEATARLAHHVARNWPAWHDRDPVRAGMRAFGDRLIADFDDAQEPATRFLEAATRWALAATRARSQEE